MAKALSVAAWNVEHFKSQGVSSRRSRSAPSVPVEAGLLASQLGFPSRVTARR